MDLFLREEFTYDIGDSNNVRLGKGSPVGAVITVEGHNIIGGLGSAVAKTLSENCPVKLKRMGIADVFTESGTHDELLDKYGLAVCGYC
jgi:transketolase C-terminal domain/subunit